MIEKQNTWTKKQMAVSVVVLVALICMLVFVLQQPEITGFVTVEGENNYTQELNLMVSESSEHSLEILNPSLRSLKLNGLVSTTGSAKVYLEHEGERYLIFDNSQLQESNIITGYVVLDETASNETTETVNETTQKEITVDLVYNPDSSFDTDNNGIENIDGAIDFTIIDSVFNWGVDESKLCTRWKVDSGQEITIMCYGAQACCNFVELEPYIENWNGAFVLSYGSYDSDESNIVSAQVIYADIDNAEIYYSDWAELSAKFISELVAFEDVCLETCLLDELNATSYTLVFEIDGAVLNITDIDYSVGEVTLEAPSIKVRDKVGRTIASYELTDRPDGKFDVELTPRKAVRIGLAPSARDKDWNVKIKGANKPEINAKIDKLDDNKITTDVFVVVDLTIEEAEITLPKNGPVDVILRCDDFDIDTFTCSEWVETDIPFTDNGDTITFTVDHFSGYAGGQITIINVQSYPMVGGNWTVRFTTNGTANLTVTAIDGTSFGVDLEFLELKCGDTILNVDYDGTRVFYENYQCSEEGSETSLVLTPGKHHLMFEFGDSVGYANNTAITYSQSANPHFINNSNNITFEVWWDDPNPHFVLICKDYDTCGPNADGGDTTQCWYDPVAGTNRTDGCWCADFTLQTGNGAGIKATCEAKIESNESTNSFYALMYFTMDHWYNGSVNDTPGPTSTFEVNHRPTAINVDILPTQTSSEPNTSSTLTCNYTFYDPDPGDSESAVNFTWWVGGTEITGENSNTLDSQFNKTNVTICGVKVTDNHGFPDDIFENSSSVTIRNSPPTAPTITVIPSSPSVGRDAYCNVTTNSTDADNDPVNYTYQWINSSILVRTFGPTDQLYDLLGSGNTSYGETWICNVTPFDGEAYGPNASIEFIIQNTAPEARNVVINSTDNLNRTNGTLAGGWEFYDEDNGDSQTDYETKWYENGAEDISLRYLTQVSSYKTTKGDIWKFSVRVSDGIVWSAWSNSTNLTIVNALPEHTTPFLNTTIPANSSSSNFTCIPKNVNDVDNDNVKAIINWYRNSESLTVLNMPFEGWSNATHDAGNYTIDYSGYGNNGTVSGATWSSIAGYVTGYDGFGAYEFDGIDDFINVSGIPLNLTTEVTISTWVVFRKNDAGNSYIVNKMESDQAGYALGILSGEDYAVCMQIANASRNTSCSKNYALSGWTHVAGTYNGTEIRIYINGELENSTQWVRPIGDNDYSLKIGARETGAADFFNGTLDELMIFNRSLSAAQIKAIYENGNDLIVSDEVEREETWKCKVTPNDREADGTALDSNILITVNTAPTHDNPLLTSTYNLNSSGENLTCNAVNLVDLDGDELKQTINWYVNDASILVLNMPFDVNHTQDNITRDYTPFENNGTVNGSTWNATGGFDGKGAYEFDEGGLNYITTGTNLGITEFPFTISTWFKTSDSNANFIHIVNNTEPDIFYELSIQASLLTLFSNAAGSQAYVQSTDSINDGAWHHGVAVFTSDTDKELYLDGESEGTATANSPFLAFNDVSIGRRGDSTPDLYYKGTLDEVMIFNRSLSAEQVKALYENRTDLIVSQETNQFESWKCDLTPNDGELEAAKLTSNTLTLRQSPTINTSNISKLVSTNFPTLSFSITGGNDINISSLLLYIYGVNSTYHTLVGSTYYDSYGYTFGNNITCTGNDTDYDCQLTLNNITSGHYNLTFSVRDIGGDMGYAYIYNYIVDTTPPVVLAIYNGYYDTEGHISPHSTIETLFANWTYEEDNESGVAYFEYSVGTAQYPNGGWNNTKGWTRVNITNNSVSVTLNLMHMWVYYFNLRSINNATLISDVISSSGVLYQDVSPPACPGGSGTGGCIHDDGDWTRFDTTLHAFWNFTDNGSAIVLYEYAIGTAKYTDPPINYSNIAGPTQTSVSDVTVNDLELGYNKTYYWNVRAKNENGKWSQWYYSDNITVDNVKPYNGSLSYDAINTTVNITTVTINTGTDDLSQVGTVVLQKARATVTEGVCGGFANYETVNISLGQGQYSVGVNLDQGYCHKFRLVVYDYAGNLETYYYSGGESFYVDTTPPQGGKVSLNNDAFWTTQQQLVINWSPAYDPESGIDYYTYFVNDSQGEIIWQWTNTTATFVSLTNLSMEHLETSRAYVKAYNPVGLSVMNYSNDVLYKDTIAPNPVTVIMVETDTNSSGGWLDIINNGDTNITALADESEITCYLTVGDMDYSSAEVYGTRCNTTNYNVNCNVSVSEGTYTHHITCRDQQEGEQTAAQNTQVNFIVDWSAPNITITNPSSGEIMGEIVNFEIEISDERGVDSAWYYIMNASWNTTGNLTSPWDFVWDSSTVSDGNYTIRVYANDTGGLTNNESVNFTVDNTRPAVDILYPNTNKRFFNGNFNLNLTVRNTFVNTSYNITNGLGVLVQNNSNTSILQRTSHDWTDNVNISGWPDGNYTISIYAVDAAQNSITKTFVFFTDQTAPPYSNIARTPDPIYNDMDVKLNTTWPNPFNTIANQYELDVVIFSHNASGTWTNITTPIDPDDVFTATISSSLLNNSETVYWYSYAMDFVGNANQTPMQTFTVQNRMPIFNGTIPDQSWPEDTSNNNINLSSYYYDLDYDNLSYSSLIMPKGTLLYDALENETDVTAIGGIVTGAGFVNGRYTNGVLIESTSTNLIVNPSFEDNSSGLDNWTSYGSPQYDTTNASNSSFGVSAVKVDINNRYEQVIEIDNGTEYTLSAYLMSEVGVMTGRLHVQWLDASQAFISSNLCPIGNCSSKPTINTSYERYQTTGTSPSNAAYARIVIDNNNASDVWVDAVQFEEKPYATTFVDGTRAEGSLKYNTTTIARDNFNPAAGTIEMWVKPEWDGDDAGVHWFFREDDSTGNYFLFGKEQSAQLIFEINTSDCITYNITTNTTNTTTNITTIIINTTTTCYSNYSYTTTDISSWEKDEWHFIAATWVDSGNMSIYIDGELKNTSAGVVTPTSLATYMYAGYQADAIIDDFAVFDYTKTLSEITRDNNTQITQGLNITASISSGIVTLTPVDYWYGEHRVMFFASDGYSKTGTNNVNLEVTEDNPRFINAVNDSDTFQRYHNFTANITIRDDYGLDTYVFFENANGNWTNKSVNVSGKEHNASEIANIALSQGNQICWYYWINDTLGTSENSNTYCFTVANTVPTITVPVLNSTSGYNYTYDNLTVYFSEADVDDDSVKSIINWYRNNVSIALLNMPFENDGSNAGTNDYSGYGHNMTVNGSTWSSSSGYDGFDAYSFDGNDYINTTLSDLGITQVMWVKNSSDTSWHHVANVSGTQYIDGVLGTGRTIPISISAGNVIIGQNYSGTIDDVMIFNRSLTATQIKLLYMNRTDLILSDETSKGETWYTSVTPNDGTADGTTRYSNNLTIPPNSVPTIAATILNATTEGNWTYDNLTLHIINTTDVDNDDVKNIINWYVDNASIALLNMPFEGGSNSTYTKDYSGQGNDGVVSDATWSSSAGYDGKGAYSFDGDGDYINLSSTSFDGTGDLTLSFWIYPKIWGEGGVGSIIDNSQFAVYTTSFAGGFIQYVSDGGTIAGTDPGYISLNTWQHIVITRPSDGDNSNIYVNGVIGGTANQNSGTPAASTNFYIGSNAGGTQDFNGTIDEIMIFNRTLTAAQIKALYNNRNDLILSDETNKSEVWYATVTPNDGEEDGATYASNNITVSNLNTPPYFVQSLTDQNAYVGVNFTYDIDADDKDPGETVTYFDNATQFNISIATGVINWTTPSVAESFVVNITVCDDSGASNNCTSDTFTMNVYTLSTIVSSTINNSHHTYNVTADIPGIMGSVINLSTISGPIIDTADSNIYNSTIINSTILRCNISDSTVDNTDCTDTEIDPSDIKESDTTGSNIINSHVWYSSATYSRITDSTIDYSDVDNSTVTDATITNSTIKDSNILNDSVITDSIIINSTIDNSTITNSTVTNSTVIDAVIYDAVVINANISDGILYSGNITWGDNNVAGPENLTDIINYAPTAVINASPTSGTDSVTVIFNGTLSTDPNMPGDLNDYLNYTWGFGDTSPYNYSNITSHTYTSSTIATLTVTDKYGRTDSATVDISVASSGTSAPSSSGGGGGGGGSSAGRMSTIQLIDAGIDTCFGVNSGVSFAFDNVLHTITLTTLGDYYVVLSMPTVEGNLLGGGIILYVDQYAKYDLNKDQYYDFDMRLNSVQSGRACFTMRSVHQAVPPPSVPTTTVTEREPEKEPTTPMPRPPKIVTTPGETYTPPVRPSFKLDLKTAALGLLPIILIVGMLVWLVIHKRSTAVVEERKDPIEAYISSLMEKGKSIQEVHRELVKRWPKENAYAAELRHIIKEASKKMSLEEIHRNLVKKGWPADMVKSAIMGHFMRDKISKGKPIEHAKAKLLKAGWKEEEIRKHLKKAK